MTDIKQIPKNLIDRSKVQEALIFISEQNIALEMKVLLLIGYGRSLNQIFSLEQIEFALREHPQEDVTQE
jgi:hypothetical protein